MIALVILFLISCGALMFFVAKALTDEYNDGYNDAIKDVFVNKKYWDSKRNSYIKIKFKTKEGKK